MIGLAKTAALFALTALAEIVGCYIGAAVALADMSIIALQPDRI